MLKLYNKEHVAVAALTNLKDHKNEYVLSGEDLKEFSLSIADENISLVEEEGYVRDKNNEYVIKAMDPSQSYKRFNCIVNVESIKGKSIEKFDTSNNSVTDTIRLAIAGTGWILADNNISKRRTVRLENTDALEVLREVRKVFRIDYRFDAINKIIYVYEKFGTDKGVYFSDELNLKSLQIPSDTYDYATRLYPYGKDGLNIKDINNGKEYIENFQYSKKIIEKIWKDERYTIIDNLKEDAIAKLEELSKPRRSYQADIVDLAKMSNEYEFLDFFLGDTITLISKQEKFRDKQRIVKYIEYPDNPSQNTCELGNTTLTFEELQQENKAKNQVVDNITNGNNTVNGSTIDGIRPEQIYDFEASVAKITDLTVINAKIYTLEANNVTITGKLNAVEARIGTFEANVATIDKLTVTHSASINDLQANKASITQLEAVNATISVLEATVGKIETLVNGNLSSENIQAGGITSDKLTIENGFIKNVMVESLDVNKVNAGDISTNKFRIKSDDGGIEIVGATQQFKDKNNKIRIQMGKDAQGNFNFIIRGEDGTTTLIDHTGIKAKAIADDLIISNMIASDAVGEKQINYSSFTNGFNKDDNTNTLRATKIKLDNQNQTLEMAFNSLKTQADGTKSLTESHSTTINVMQGQISTAINNTQIVKDGQTILLKDDYNRTVATVNSINSTIGSHTTQINQATGKIENVETKVNTVERDLNSINERLSSTETKIVTVNDLANNALSKAQDANGKIDNLNIGGRNLATNTGEFTIMANWASNNTGAISIEDKCIKGLTSIKHEWTPLKPNTTYMVTLVFKSDADTFMPNDGHGGHFHVVVNDQTDLHYGKKSCVLVSNEPYQKGVFKKYVYKIVTKDNITNPRLRCMVYHPDYLTGKNIWLKYLKVEEGNKATDWTPAPEDFEYEITSIDSKVVEVQKSLSGINSRVECVESKQITVNDKVVFIETWKKEAEQRITDSAIVSTVTKSSVYQNALNGKVSTNYVVSSINQSAEAVKINANKIELNGVTTAGNLAGGRYVKIENETYTAYNNNIKVLEQGVRDWSGRLVPALYMGSDGFKSGSTGTDGTYFAMFNFPSANGNPSFQHLGLRNAKTGLWSVIEFNDQGVMAIRPEMNLNISGPEFHLLSTNIYFEGKTHFTQVIDCRHIDCAGIRVGASAKFPFGAVFDDKGRTAIEKAATGDDLGVLTTCLYPKFDAVQYLGNTAFRWRQLYCTTAPDISSDISLKENIVYTDEKSIVPQLAYLYNEEDHLTYKDMYDFYKDIYRSAEYNYIGDDKTVLGIIANDIVNTKVGNKIVNYNEDGKLSYSLETRVTVAEGALKATILEIEDEKQFSRKAIADLTEKLNKANSEIEDLKQQLSIQRAS